MQLLQLLACCLLCAACHSARDEDSSGVDESKVISLDGWRTERITLPPEFAPGLPKGTEQLLFAPGMFTADAEDFWSYVFTLDLHEGRLDAQRITELLEVYYDGLLVAVAGDQGQDLGEDVAQVQLVQVSQDHFEAKIDLIDTFVTMQPLVINVKIHAKLSEAERTVLHVRASPKPVTHVIWETLQVALESIE